MRRALKVAFAALLMISISASPTNAQFVVYDPTNYAQALARYAQLLQQYQFWVRQARRIPIDMATRYLVPTVRWRTHSAAKGWPRSRPTASSTLTRRRRCSRSPQRRRRGP